jgi:hypothetical protein
MIELECPWCQEPARLDFAAFVETGAVRCESCRVVVEPGEPDLAQAIALAA